MTSSQTARFILRDATAAWHQRVDDVFSAIDLTDRAEYGRFLRAQAAAHVPVERALAAADILTIVPDWPIRERAHLLYEDLAALGLAAPTLEPQPAFAGAAAMLGATYVLEGSRLGGTLLKRSVPTSFPTAFLSGGTSAAWRELISLLDARLATDEDTDAAVDAACDVFALFERSGRRFVESGRRGD